MYNVQSWYWCFWHVFAQVHTTAQVWYSKISFRNHLCHLEENRIMRAVVTSVTFHDSSHWHFNLTFQFLNMTR